MSYRPAHAAQGTVVTFYNLTGVTASCPYPTNWECQQSGHWTSPGVAACSWNWPTYTRLRFFDGREVVCLDRGLLGSTGHIDVWMPSYYAGLEEIEAVYGQYTFVEVIE